MNTIIIVFAALISLILGIFIGFILRKNIAESKFESAEREAKRIIQCINIE